MFKMAEDLNALGTKRGIPTYFTPTGRCAPPARPVCLGWLFH
jgi:hypothetical protein